jgi:hypothetical protein
MQQPSHQVVLSPSNALLAEKLEYWLLLTVDPSSGTRSKLPVEIVILVEPSGQAPQVTGHMDDKDVIPMPKLVRSLVQVCGGLCASKISFAPAQVFEPKPDGTPSVHAGENNTDKQSLLARSRPQ